MHLTYVHFTVIYVSAALLAVWETDFEAFHFRGRIVPTEYGAERPLSSAEGIGARNTAALV